MSRIDKQILELCPDGVIYKELGGLISRVDGSNRKIVKSKIQSFGKYPVYTQGASQKPYGFSDDKDAVIRDVPVILYGDHTNSLKWIDHNFIAGADGVKLIKSFKQVELNDKFLYYCLRDKMKQIPDGYARHFAKLRKLSIPIPPLEVQKEIVNILDKFTQLEAELSAELSAELEARRRQYEFYRNQLFTFDESKEKVRWLTINEVCKSVSAGGDLPKSFKKGQLKPSSELPYPIFSNGSDNKALYGYTDNYKIDKEAVSISARGTIGFHAIRPPKFTPIVRLITLIPDNNIVTIKYLNYVLDITEIGHSGGSIPQLTVPNVKKIKIPVPFIGEQNRITDILDKFEVLTNNISEGLPAEIAARRKQYKYYRTKLLTFKELK